MSYTIRDIQCQKEIQSGVYFRVGKEVCVDSTRLNNGIGDAVERYKFYSLAQLEWPPRPG